MSSSGPVAIVTGGAQRLGASIATHLHRAGYRLLLHYRGSAEAARELADGLNRTRPHSVSLRQADFAQDDGEVLVSSASDAFGQLDLVVNNASEFFPTPMGRIRQRDWNRLFVSNAKGPLFLSQAAAPLLAERAGAIVNILDIYAQKPLVEHTVYCMAKAALHMMTLSLAVELAPTVRVNGVAPGAILWPQDQTETDDHSALLKRVPMARQGQPQDIAQAVSYLAQAPYVTGQIIAVDGGRSLNM